MFSRLQNVRSAKRFPELRAAMATAAGEFDLATQKEGLNFFASAFKEVRSHRQLLGEVLEKDKWRDHLRALPEKLGSAERVTAKVTEVLSCLILGHLRRTVQEKGKRQQDQRRFILQQCSLVGTDFLLDFVDHVVREAAPQLARERAEAAAEAAAEKDNDGGDGGENLGMALDICVQTCPLLQSDNGPNSGAALRRLNDNCVDLLCLIGGKMCGGGDGGGVNSKARSRLLSIVQKAFKGFKGLTMNAEQMRRFVESCVAPALRRDDNASSTQVSSKLVPLLDAWLGDNSSYLPLFMVTTADGETPLSLLNAILGNNHKVKIESSFLAKLLDRLSKYFVMLSEEQQQCKKGANVQPEDMRPLADHLLQWLGSKQPLKHKVSECYQ